MLLALKLDFVQDDAFISYRYVANFLNGHGLVYNIGERIEGFTNFGWVIYMILWGALGAGYMMVSKITGYLLGIGVIMMTFLIARHIFSDKNKWFALIPTYLVGFNMSLAYWAPAGLETAAFTFFASLALYFFLRRSWFLIYSLALAVWLRPEGALLAGLFVVIELITERRTPWFSLRCLLVALILSLPMAVFKVVYYGSIFPNPFFAKTGLHWDQIANGLEYTWRFLSEYGFYGIGFVVPLVFYRRLSKAEWTVWLFATLYTFYVLMVGGDVLKVHRFFLPVFGAAAILAAMSLRLIFSGLVHKNRLLVIFMVSLPLLGLTYVLPRNHVETYNYVERLFIKKMQHLAVALEKADSTNFSAALPTIGVFGYELLGHDIIDMVGLTDSTIARHSEKPIEGMQTTWKEQKHNSAYLLGRSPDYIVFSTGIKPSAPAERALLLYPQFLNAYRTIGWYYVSVWPDKGTIISAFKRVREVKGPFEPTYPVAYVQHFKKGLDAYVSGDHETAIAEYSRALKVSPQPYNVYLIYQKAFSHMLKGEHDKAMPLMDMVLRADSMVFEAHKDLYLYAKLMGDEAKADIHRRWLDKLVPWYSPKIQRDAAKSMRSAQEAMQRSRDSGG